MPMPRTLIEYYKVDKNYVCNGKRSKCWIAFNKLGLVDDYAQCNPHSHLGEYLLHRYMYVKYKGKIPKDRELDHLCLIKACCNPAHLEAVTDQEQSDRKYKVDPHFMRRFFKANPNHFAHRRKLNAKQVTKILKLHQEGRSYRSLHIEFEVSSKLIASICKGFAYKHVKR